MMLHSWANALFILVLVSITLVFRRASKKYRLPPFTSDIGLSNFIDGSVIRLIYTVSQKIGLVFRIRIPFLLSHYIIVNDENLARKILEGDKSIGLLPGDRTSRIQRINKLFFGCPTLFTRKTRGEGWDWARKAIAPEFSMANISKSILKLHVNLGKLEGVIYQRCEEGKPFDIAKLMTQFTFNFILAALFNLKNNHTEYNDSIGNALLDEIEDAVQEYGIKQHMNPLRGYMFWDKEVIRAKNALKVIEAYIKNLIFEYKSSKTDDEIKTDDSLLGRLLRRCLIKYNIIIILTVMLILHCYLFTLMLLQSVSY